MGVRVKIVHLAVARHWTHGQAKQFRFEYDAVKGIECAEWTTVAYQDQPASEPMFRQTPLPFRMMFMRNLWTWVIALRLSKTHDIVMMRHMTFDPFAFIFAPLIPNRVSVHHAKEVEELRLVRKGWRGRAAARLERASGAFAVSRAKMIFGVTREIAEYQRDTRAPDKEIGVYPNGVDVSRVPLLADKRKHDQINIAFICGTFSAWHGLDKLIEAVDAGSFAPDDCSFSIHLIGNLSAGQIEEISANEKRSRIFKCHGLMNADEYRNIIDVCDYGVASLAMTRQNLKEGSTLKVREMLAMGLPVYSGHQDLALPEDEKFVFITKRPNMSEMVAFGKYVKTISRDFVRERSKGLIEKKEAMKSVAKVLSECEL
jgi:glycosyltransferase involved in cell wall biosynthesis